MSSDPYGTASSDQPTPPESSTSGGPGPVPGQQPDDGGAPGHAPYGTPPHTGHVPPYGQAPYGQAPYGQAPYGQAPYGQPSGDPAAQPPYGQYPQQPYPYAQPGYAQPGYAPGPGTDGLAVGALISGIAGLSVVPLIASVVAIVLGIMSLGRIRASGQEGRGMAIAGIVMGAIGVVFLLLAIVALLVFLGVASTHHGSFVEFSSAV